MAQGPNLNRAQVLLSLQRALWDAVTPDLRAVSVGWSSGLIEATFVYDRPVDDELTDLVSVVETEVLADFSPDVSTAFELVHVPAHQDRRVASREWWAYLRHET